MTITMKGFIYLLQVIMDGRAVYKIGRTNDMTRRTIELARIYGDFTVLRLMPFCEEGNVEDILHRQFHAKRYKKRSYEELFDLDSHDIEVFDAITNALDSFEIRMGKRRWWRE